MLDVAPRSVDRRLLLVLGVGVLVVALVLGGFAVADRLRGGASSPTELAALTVTALDDEDVGALARLVEPGERTALARLVGAWSDRLAALDLPTAVGGGPVPGAGHALDGLDLSLSGPELTVRWQRDDLAWVALPGLTARVRTEPGEARGLLATWFTYRRETVPRDLTLTADALPGVDGVPGLLAVQRSGRWYLSVLGTALALDVDALDAPAVEAVTPVASPTPESAAEATIRGVYDARARHDLGPLLATLDPTGADLVRLVGAGVLEATRDDTGDRVDSVTLGAEPAGADRAEVRVDRLRVSGPAHVDVDGPCATLAGLTPRCLTPSPYRYEDGQSSLGLLGLLGHGGAFRLTVVRDRDGWRVSVPDSVADALVAYADGLTREQLLALLRRPVLDAPGGTLTPDRAEAAPFTSAGYAVLTLHVEQAGLYRVVPSPTGSNRATLYDPDGQPSVQPFYPNDSSYRLTPGDHTLLVWADDGFADSLAAGTPYTQQVEVRTVR